jgi:hypothetical protein
VKFSKDLKMKGYNTFVNIDIGIAICHFDLTAKELELGGEWKVLEPNLQSPKNLKYVISWIGSN